MLLIVRALTVLMYLIIADALLSWVQSPRQAPRRWTMQATEPLYAPLRNILPPVGGFDLAPMVLIIVLAVLRRVVIGLA